MAKLTYLDFHTMFTGYTFYTHPNGAELTRWEVYHHYTAGKITITALQTNRGNIRKADKPGWRGGKRISINTHI